MVQSAPDTVCGLEETAVGDHHAAATWQVRSGDRVGDLVEPLALLLAAPVLAVGLKKSRRRWPGACRYAMLRWRAG